MFRSQRSRLWSEKWGGGQHGAGSRNEGIAAWHLVVGFWTGVLGTMWCWGGFAPTTNRGFGPGPAVAVAPWVSVFVVASVFLLGAAMLLVYARSSPWLRAVALVAGLGLGISCANSATEPKDLVVHQRGTPRGLWALGVVGAGHPGARCSVETTTTARSTSARLWVGPPGEGCHWSGGERVVVMGAELQRRLPRPSRVDPRTRAAALEVDWAARTLASPPTRPRLLERYWAWVADVREAAWSWSREDPRRRLVVACGLGLASALPSDDRDDLRRVGLGHLIAVSGLHVSLLALVVFRTALRGTPGGTRSMRWAALAGLLVVAAYVGLTGAAAPAVRAACSYGAVVGGWVGGRRVHRRFMPAAVLMGMVVVRPGWLIDPGFQLSALATWGIITALPVGTGAALEGPPSVLRLSWRIAWATAGVSLWWFGRAGWIAVPVNVFALPVFTFLVMPFALAGAGLALVAGDPAPLVEPALWGAGLLLDGAAALSDVLDAWEAGARRARLPSWGGSAWSFVALGVGWNALAWARRRLGRDARDASGWRPPGWAVLSLAYACWLGGYVERTGPVVVAVARTRSTAVLVAEGRDGPSCLRLGEDGRGVIDWPGLTQTLGIAGIDAVDAPGDDPAVAALRASLHVVASDVGHTVAATSCAEAARVEPSSVAAARACARRFGDDTGIAVMREGGASTRCWSRVGWRTLEGARSR